MSPISHTFKIISLNCKHEIYKNPFQKSRLFAQRKERILMYLTNEQPLLVGLQEFTDEMHEYLAPSLQRYTIVGKNRYHGHSILNEQTAIIVNNQMAKILDSNTIWLSNTPDTSSQFLSSLMSRTCTIVEIELHASKQRLRCFNVHLDVVFPYTRYKQAMILLKYIDKLQQIDPLPFVITGDFNDRYDSKTIQLFRLNQHEYDFTLQDMYTIFEKKDMHPTYHGFKNKIKAASPIDYIFVSSPITIHAAAIITNHSLPLSDHFPIIAEISLPHE